MNNYINKRTCQVDYNDFNFYCRGLAPGTVCLTGDRVQGDDSKQCAYRSEWSDISYFHKQAEYTLIKQLLQEMSDLGLLYLQKRCEVKG